MAENTDAQDILFLCEYLNIAWGVRYDGIFINRDGQVYRFGEKAGMSPPLSRPGLCRAEYLAWVRQQAILEGQVNLAELEQKSRLIEEAAQGEIIPEVGTCDAGVRSYQAFRSQGGQPEEILLASVGDRWLTNQSPEAAELVNWLKGVWGMLVSKSPG
jgi:hypothetical protein